ncbi:glycosyltransferase [Mycolicibacterium pulveris]|uniref:Glycosyl transferase n=1 Tax=Mycolicibacterium pulveris TaxID=36813 RepID=A0A7I7UFQ3_MYCPV|nr:glycosyltransferase [Mycolicibacterium pulveris]MCV6979075.1 glycosyltransferase [Mycolicibacterium pulveris]BBY79721.1 glycosyl transferase [Mycolicibacterium pulveris]
MKIAMVSEYPGALAVSGGPDGADRQTVHIADLSAALARRGHQVTVYTRRDDPGLPDRVETAHGYTVAHVPAGPPEPIPDDELLAHMGPFAQFLDAAWAVDRPDVTHAHSWMSGIATQLAARHLNLPAVLTFHTLGYVEPRRQGLQEAGSSDRWHLEATVARTATWVVATCTDEISELMRMGRSRSRMSVVPCGVDLDLFNPEGPRVGRGKYRRIVSTGTLVPHNGFDVLVRALPYIRDTELVIVSGPDITRRDSDPEAHRLRELAERLGVADRVRLYQRVAREDLPSILRSADVVACTPGNELLGAVSLEAMACGVPVIASAVGALLDTVVHDVTGRLVRSSRPDKVADAVNQLLRDDFLRQSLGAAGRDRARARYSWDRIAGDTNNIYRRLAPVPVGRIGEPATSRAPG